MKIDLNLICQIFAICLAILQKQVLGYTCSTPEDWLSNGEFSKVYVGNSRREGDGQKWPGGIVKYHLNSSLTNEDKQEVLNAFEEFHRKTCIRFEPAREHDSNYVSIEADDTVCGMAHVCMQGGYQFAKFGKNCRKMNTMIHQLGHTICLSHEEHRYQGDKSVSFNETCSLEIKRPSVATRIYDQASQMHADCEWSASKCGFQITPGLSALDADYINAMYNCQGCYRHRWIPKEALTLSPLPKHSLNGTYVYASGQSIYPCRAFFGMEIGIGIFKYKDAACYIGSGGKVHKLCEQFEVLNIPGGLGGVDSQYFLKAVDNEIIVTERNNAAVVVSGRVRMTGETGYSDGYVAFGMVAKNESCGYKPVWWSGAENKSGNAIGRAWLERNVSQAIAPICGNEQRFDEYNILACRNMYRTDVPNTSTSAILGFQTIARVAVGCSIVLTLIR